MRSLRNQTVAEQPPRTVREMSRPTQNMSPDMHQITANEDGQPVVFVIHRRPRQFDIAKYWLPVLIVYLGNQSALSLETPRRHFIMN